jgi:hypothetical protein
MRESSTRQVIAIECVEISKMPLLHQNTIEPTTVIPIPITAIYNNTHASLFDLCTRDYRT